MRRNDDIEKLFRERFEGYRLKPSAGVWQRVMRQLRWQNFLRFSPRRFNIWYLSALMAVVAGGTWLLYGGDKKEQDLVLPAKEEVRPAPPKKNVAADTSVSGEQKQGKNFSAEEKGKLLPSKKGMNERSPNVKVQEKKEEEALSDDPRLLRDERQGQVAEEKQPAEDVEVRDMAAMGVGREPHASGRGSEAGDEMPVARFTLSPRRGCPPLEVHVTDHSEHAESRRWKVEPRGYEGDAREPVLRFREPGTYVVKLTVRARDGRVAHASDTVVVYEPPRASFDWSPQELTESNEPVTFFNTSLRAVRSFWSFGDGHTSLEEEPIHHFTEDGPFDVMLVVWSEQGCADTLVRKGLFQREDFYIRFPNAFIANPNGPTGGYYTEGALANDVFHPVWKGVATYHLQVFNRMGELVFESRDLHKGWDGYILDQMAAPGVYIWKATGTFTNGKPYVRFGNVTLIRKKQGRYN